MRGSDQRPANVIVTFLVSWLVGLPVACCLGAVAFNILGTGRLGGAVWIGMVVLGAVVPGVFAWWWNYRKRSTTRPGPWV